MQCAAVQRTRKWGRGIAIVTLAWSLQVGGATFAQTTSTFNQDFRLWAPIYLTMNLPSSFLAYLDVTPRFADLDGAGHIDQLLLRPALGYQLTENLSIWQGYAWVGNFNQPHRPPQSPFFLENRIYQQVTYSATFKSFRILSRARLEERLIEDVDGASVRFRTMLRGMYPLPMASEWALVVYDEIFVNLNTVGTVRGKGPEAGFDQNRFFVGINRTFGKHFNMDAGYHNQLLDSRSLPNLANRMNHMILLQFFIDLE